MKLKALILAALAAVSLAAPADSVEPLSTPELASHCAFDFTEHDKQDAVFSTLQRKYPSDAQQENKE